MAGSVQGGRGSMILYQYRYRRATGRSSDRTGRVVWGKFMQFF